MLKNCKNPNMARWVILSYWYWSRSGRRSRSGRSRRSRRSRKWWASSLAPLQAYQGMNTNKNANINTNTNTPAACRTLMTVISHTSRSLCLTLPIFWFRPETRHCQDHHETGKYDYKCDHIQRKTTFQGIELDQSTKTYFIPFRVSDAIHGQVTFSSWSLSWKHKHLLLHLLDLESMVFDHTLLTPSPP